MFQWFALIFSALHKIHLATGCGALTTAISEHASGPTVATNDVSAKLDLRPLLDQSRLGWLTMGDPLGVPAK